MFARAPISVKPCEVRGVAAVKNRSTGILEEKTSKSAMTIVKNARAPMAGGRQRDFERAMFKALPRAQLMDPVKSQAMHEIADMLRHRDRLVAGDGAQSPAIKMIEMGMCHQDKIDRRKVADLDPGILDTFDHF